MNSKNDKRRSSMVPACGSSSTSYVDQFSATSENSSYYTTSNSTALPRGVNNNVSVSPAPTLLGCLTPGTPQWESQAMFPGNAPAKSRQKAVITVNSETTEILIANDNLRRLFDLNCSSSSLIGRKLTDVFPSHKKLVDENDCYQSDSTKFSLEIDEYNQTPLHSALFGENGKLKPVYGKPVDIHDTNGQLSTVCLWSYPLTSPIQTISSPKERKTSVMLMRSPSAFLPNTNPNQPIPTFSNLRQSTTSSLKKSSDLSEASQNASTSSSTNKCTFCKNNSSKSSVGSQLKVLREEEFPTTNLPNSTRTPSHAPPALQQEPKISEKRFHSPDQNSKSEMVAQGELLNAGGNDEEDDKELGFVQRTFRRFNFRDHQEHINENSSSSSTAATSHPITIQTAQNNAERRMNFMCGSTPVLSTSIPSPPISSIQQQNLNDNESAKSNTPSNLSEHHSQHNECCCKAVNLQQTTKYAPLNPHHDAQHATNHMCNNAANCRWLILMEPINALHINVTLGAKGRIFRTDDALAAVLGYDCTNRLFGTEIHRLIPELKTEIEMNSKPQQCCGSSIKRNGVPFTAVVVVELDKDQNPMAFNVQLRSLSSINGVVTITDAGVVYSYNENFLNALIGRDLGKTDDLILITDLIPGFYESSTIASLNTEQLNAASARESESDTGLTRVDESEESSSSTHSRHRTEGRSNSVPTVQVGAFYGLVKHENGVAIPIRFDVTRLDMQSTPRLFAVGIGYERGIDYGINQMHESDEDAINGYTRQSSSSGAESDVEMRTLKLTGGDEEFENGSEGLQMSVKDVTLSALADESNEALCGEYSTLYDTYQLIGNGTFGSVKLAARKDSGLLAVTKFVCKNKVLPESWVKSQTRSNRMVPIEVHLLETLNHQNIVKVLDVFENQKYYQLVMEKLGCGMDLFEFVESHPMMDEALVSYIFRQIVGAVQYLANNGIVHRDIKDENVIIDRNFCCKLIDFGSAAYFGPDIVFSTFCGTMEYCSPEVLTGNKYLGPEVEMWSLGILLYTLVFFSNPFRTPQETVHAEFDIPHKISEGLFQVINRLLCADPRTRATITEILRHWWVNQPVDPTKYKFREVVKNSERARVSPPLYASELHNHLKNASSCGNLANSSMNNLEATQVQPAEINTGVVSAS